jgi:hypothetical protein
LREWKWNKTGRRGTLDSGVEMEGGAEEAAITAEGTWNLEGGRMQIMHEGA